MSMALGLVLAILGLVSAVVVQAASNAEIKQEQKQTTGALDREKQTNTALVMSLEREGRTSYFRSIALAERELAANNVGRAEELLDDSPVHLRGWEWHYLKRRPYAPLTFRGHNSWVLGVAFSPDGKLVASASARLRWSEKTSRTRRAVARTRRCVRDSVPCFRSLKSEIRNQEPPGIWTWTQGLGV
jgi:hypothetical protein